MNRKTESKIVSELMSKLNETIREGEYGSWSDLWCGMELPKPFPVGFQINVWGEQEDALTDGNSYSVNICRDDTDPIVERFTHSDNKCILAIAIGSALKDLESLLIASGVIERPKSRAKYREGEVIRSLGELAEQDLIYFCGKIIPFGWFMNWQMRTAKNLVDSGSLRKAYKKEEST